MMLITGLVMADESLPEKTDTEPVVSKEEIKKLEEEQARTSKYLFFGTLVAIPPGIVAAVAGVITLVSGGAAIYFLMRLVDVEYSGVAANHQREVSQWTAWSLALGTVASGCSICAGVSCMVSIGAFSSGVKAFLEDPSPSE